jgi:hypothetical protein
MCSIGVGDGHFDDEPFVALGHRSRHDHIRRRFGEIARLDERAAIAERAQHRGLRLVGV